jgi:large subunit ribosomal protein L10
LLHTQTPNGRLVANLGERRKSPLALTKEQKEKIIADYMEKFAKSEALILADYRGMNVANTSRLRQQLRESGNGFIVVKNTLARIALERTGRPVPADAWEGPTAMGLCYKDIATVAKILDAMAQETKLLPLRGAILGRRVVGAEEAKKLADMPPRAELLGRVVGGIQAPLSGLVGVLAGPLQGLLNVLQGRVEQLNAAAS